MQPLVYIILIVAIAGLGGVSYFYRTQLKQLISNLLQDSTRRKADAQALSRKQKQAYDLAQNLIKDRKYVAAAQLLESVGLMREAVDLLEEHQLIEEAANLLLRLQRPNRAGVMYAKYKIWDKAARAFKQANMPFEAGQSFLEMGEYREAGRLFLSAGNFGQAAAAFAECGDTREAARAYARAGNAESAVMQIAQFLESQGHSDDVKLEEGELAIVVDYLGNGHAHLRLADVLAQHQRLSDAIILSLERNHCEVAARIYLRSTTDISAQLLARSLGKKDLLQRLAKMFEDVSNFLFAAKAYEQLDEAERAANAFERAESFAEAAQWYAHVGLDDRALEMRAKLQAKTNLQNAHEVTAKLQINPTALMQPLAEALDNSTVGTHSQLLPRPQIPKAFLEAGVFTEIDYVFKKYIWDRGLVRRFEAQAELATPSDKDGPLRVLVSGRVSIVFAEGENRMLQAGALIAPTLVFLDQQSVGRYKSETDVEVFQLEREKLMQLIDQNGTFAFRLLRNFILYEMPSHLAPGNGVHSAA